MSGQGDWVDGGVTTETEGGTWVQMVSSIWVIQEAVGGTGLKLGRGLRTNLPHVKEAGKTHVYIVHKTRLRTGPWEHPCLYRHLWKKKGLFMKEARKESQQSRRKTRNAWCLEATRSSRHVECCGKVEQENDR